jgi:osmotically-inducible protein OsmY
MTAPKKNAYLQCDGRHGADEHHRGAGVSIVDTSADRRYLFEQLLTASVAVLSVLWGAASMAQHTAAPANAGAASVAQHAAAPANALGEITVTGRKIIPDEEVSQQVELALKLDPYVDDRHVTVTTKNGIVTIQGFVQDAWDLLALRRIAKRVAGVKKVVNDVELVLNDQ